MSGANRAVAREKRNWLLHRLYVRKEFDACLELIEEQLEQSNGLSEHALFVKGLIRRYQGKISESLKLFQAATCLSPRHPSNLKQVARSLYLMGRHRAALQVFEEGLRVVHEQGKDDWELFHGKGLCFVQLRQYSEAIEAFHDANAIQRHDSTFLQLAKAYMATEDFQATISVLEEALEFSSDSSKLLTTLGLVYLRRGENFRAFEYLGNSLTHDPRDPKTILAAGSIMQDNKDMDVALVKYRVAAVQTPNSPELWNNVGMCLFGQHKYVAAVASLKRAHYLDPFKWIISYNLGLVHLTTGQYASAFHFLSSSINLKPNYASAYMYLGLTLSQLGEFDRACVAYDKAIDLDPDYLSHLNYAITLYKNGKLDDARVQFDRFRQEFDVRPSNRKTFSIPLPAESKSRGDVVGLCPSSRHWTSKRETPIKMCSNNG